MRWRACLLACALVAGCADSTGPAGEVDTEVSLPVSGGTVDLLGGLLRLDVPAGVLVAETRFQGAASTGHPGAALMVPGTAVVVHAEPPLAGSVQITLKYDAARLPAALRHEELRLYRLVGGFWRRVAGSAPGLGATVSASVDSLGAFALLGVPAASVEVLPAQVRMSLGEQRTLTARVRDADGSLLPGRGVSWASAKLPVATVNDAGVVTAVGPGIGHIAAGADGVWGSNSVVVDGDH